MSEAFKLSKPIRIGGEDVSELTLREPKVEMLAHTKMRVARSDGDETILEIDADTVVRVFGRMANIPPSAVAQISGDDYPAMVDVYTRFFG